LNGTGFKDLLYFKNQNGVSTLIKSLLTNENTGISSLEGREVYFGSNKVFVKPVPLFCGFVLEALEYMIVRILIVCAVLK
jgi:hypothetical protein